MLPTTTHRWTCPFCGHVVLARSPEAREYAILAHNDHAQIVAHADAPIVSPLKGLGP